MTDQNPPIEALISLLDDPDDRIFADIRDKIFTLGPNVIPFLENAWEKAFDPIMQSRVENLIHDIQFERVKTELKKWLRSGAENVVEGALIVASYQYPDIDRQKVYDLLDDIRADIWIELNNNLTSVEIVKLINHIFFEVHGFLGNTANFHSPQNNFINHVLESKKGNPLMLSVIYMYLAKELNLPVYGVNLPEHFVLAYLDPYAEIQTDENAKILFYINPFSKGTIFSRKEIESFLKQLKLENTPAYFLPCTHAAMIQRMLRNLAYAYEKMGSPEKQQEVEQLIEVFN